MMAYHIFATEIIILSSPYRVSIVTACSEIVFFTPNAVHFNISMAASYRFYFFLVCAWNVSAHIGIVEVNRESRDSVQFVLGMRDARHKHDQIAKKKIRLFIKSQPNCNYSIISSYKCRAATEEIFCYSTRPVTNKISFCLAILLWKKCISKRLQRNSAH